MIGSAQVILCHGPDSQFLIAQGNQVTYDSVMKIACMLFHILQGILIKRQSFCQQSLRNLPLCLDGQIKMAKVTEGIIFTVFQPHLVTIQDLC